MDANCIHCDNQSCVKLLENPVFLDKSKHIEIKYHYIRDMVQKGAVKLNYVVMKEQIADVLTNPLARVKFKYFTRVKGESWCSRDKGFLQGKVMSPIAILTW